ncbi:hypothetical protein BC938DRAFT_470626 [Jimgerdemannia flammicorona]|uniref:Uncharacterized protein n=1 Tax=Jimgerdemannia flammicorona TaxID=994334 RepID=A0A433Q9Q9_9FUNG|nr:hypothetical protein BC938DRAFT_470626 [Jimgerdemannia flammicorona]
MYEYLQNVDFIIYTEIPATDIIIGFTICPDDTAHHISIDHDVVVSRTSTDVLLDHKMVVDYFYKNFNMKRITFVCIRSHLEMIIYSNSIAHIHSSVALRYLVQIPTLGNNDEYLHDQIAFGPQSLLTNLTKLWAPFNLNLGKTFANSGYFTQDILPGKLQVISMNTVYFYAKNLLVSDCDKAGSAGDVQLQWIQTNLQKARHSHYNVYLMQVYFD